MKMADHPSIFNVAKVEVLLDVAHNLDRTIIPIGSDAAKVDALKWVAQQLRERAEQLDPTHWAAAWDESPG